MQVFDEFFEKIEFYYIKKSPRRAIFLYFGPSTGGF